MLSYVNEIQLLQFSLALSLIAVLLLAIKFNRAHAAIKIKLTHLTTELKKLNHVLAMNYGLDEDGEHVLHETKLYVGNVDYAASEDDLEKYFAKFGKIEMVNIPVDRYSGKARGFGFVTFVKAGDALRAMELDGSEFKGRQIQVNFARERNNSN